MEQNRDEKKDEIEKKKEYLKRYHGAVIAEKAIQQEIDELRMDKMFPMLIQDGMPHGSSCGDLAEYAAQLDGGSRLPSGWGTDGRRYIESMEEH